MELKTLKSILRDLKYSFHNQLWIRDTEEYLRRKRDIEQLEGMIQELEEKQKVFTEVDNGFPKLSNIRIPVNIDIEIERYIKPERMDHIEKGAAIGKPRGGNIVLKGYQPETGELDETNPPRGGSGLK